MRLRMWSVIAGLGVAGLAVEAALMVASIALIGGLGRSVFAAEPERLPTGQELHQLFDRGEYQLVLQKLARVLSLKGEAARPYDRIDLEMLRGEALLRLKQNEAAYASFDAAVRAVDDTADPTEADLARATALLMKRSHGGAYTPRSRAGGQSAPISILDMSQRKSAFEALQKDLKLEMQAKVKQAVAAKALPPIVDAIKGLGDFRAVEMTATGKAEETPALLDQLTGRAKDLMTFALHDLQRQSRVISNRANELITSLGACGDPIYRKRGMDPLMGNTLKDIIRECEKIADAAREFVDINKSTAQAFSAVQDEADKVSGFAKTTLEADYTGTFAGQPPQ